MTVLQLLILTCHQKERVQGRNTSENTTGDEVLTQDRQRRAVYRSRDHPVCAKCKQFKDDLSVITLEHLTLQTEIDGSAST
jgi:hypothetical protein